MQPKNIMHHEGHEDHEVKIVRSIDFRNLRGLRMLRGENQLFQLEARAKSGYFLIAR
jgi:hypothetical protein